MSFVLSLSFSQGHSLNDNLAIVYKKFKLRKTCLKWQFVYQKKHLYYMESMLVLVLLSDASCPKLFNLYKCMLVDFAIL